MALTAQEEMLTRIKSLDKEEDDCHRRAVLLDNKQERLDADRLANEKQLRTVQSKRRQYQYALLALIHLGRQSPDDYLSVQAIAARQDIPPKFLEQILLNL